MTDKTLVTEFKLTLADLHTRRLVCSDSVATKLGLTPGDFSQLIRTVDSTTNVLTIPGISNYLLLFAPTAFVVELGPFTLTAQKLFIYNGEIPYSLAVKALPGQTTELTAVFK